MENKQVLNEKDLEKVAGGVDYSLWEFEFRCNKCGQVVKDTCSISGMAAIREKYENSQCLVCDGKYEYVDMTYVSGQNPLPTPTPIKP